MLADLPLQMLPGQVLQLVTLGRPVEVRVVRGVWMREHSAGVNNLLQSYKEFKRFSHLHLPVLQMKAPQVSINHVPNKEIIS